MKELKELNNLLCVLCEKTEQFPITDMDLYWGSNIINLERFRDRNTMLRKLIKDGYADSMINEETKAEMFFITFEGLVFIKEGGYLEQYKRLKTTKRLQSVQTWAIAIGTVLAAVFSFLAAVFSFLTWLYTNPSITK